ncbi:hypothetical protein M758_8G127400, partial [Ceratodon purpureus]
AILLRSTVHCTMTLAIYRAKHQDGHCSRVQRAIAAVNEGHSTRLLNHNVHKVRKIELTREIECCRRKAEK